MSETAEYVGPVKLEGTLSNIVLVATTGGAPTNANAVPTYSIYAVGLGSKLITNQATDTNGLTAYTGAYRVSQVIQAAAGFAAGNVYMAQVDYQMQDTTTRRKVFSFGVV